MRRIRKTDGTSGVSPRADASAPVSAAPSYLRRTGEALAAMRDAVHTLTLSVAVWMLYVPHYFVLWLLGPRLGMGWVRVAANVHWLLTFVGAQRSARRALTSMYPYFQTRLSVSQILRLHLRLKHECFARARVYNVRGFNAHPNDLHWQVNPNCADAMPPKQRERGIIVVGFHFNFYQLSATPLTRVLPGTDVVQLRYRSSQSIENAASPIARLAIKKAMEADRRSGGTVLYVDETAALVQLYRLLRQGGAVAVAADGMVADDFVEVPFFDGTLQVPSGWAKLAASTKSDVLLLCDKQFDSRTRDGWFFNHVQCTETTNEAAYAAVAESIRILEQMIRDEPWGWHPWQRLRVEIGPEGARRYRLKQFGFDGGEMLAGTPAPAIRRRDDAKIAAQNGAPRRPRVAILANSLTPYRIHLHQRIVQEVPDVELWSLATHGNAYQRWSGLAPPEEIRPVNFGHGEPTNEQTHFRYARREWFKAGRIIRWLHEHQIDAVMCQGCGDVGRMRIIRWCKRHGIPCFLTGDFNICSDNHPPLKRWIKQRVYGRAVRWSYGLMPCGQHGLALLNRYGGETKPAFMFPFVPDVELFENTPPAVVERARQRFGLPPGRRRIVFSARMMRAKRPDLAVQAFAQIADQRPEWNLVMLGEGPLRADLEASVPPDLRDRMIWTGFLDDAADVAGIYATSDVLLLPSDHEPWGVVVVEAAAAGLAIVASDVVGAAPELVQQGRNGALFATGELSSLVAALLAVTEPERIDAAKGQSTEVLGEWLAECDPVASYRGALRHCGLHDSVPPELAPMPTYQREIENEPAVPV